MNAIRTTNERRKACLEIDDELRLFAGFERSLDFEFVLEVDVGERVADARNLLQLLRRQTQRLFRRAQTESIGVRIGWVGDLAVSLTFWRAASSISMRSGTVSTPAASSFLAISGVMWGSCSSVESVFHRPCVTICDNSIAASAGRCEPNSISTRKI